MIPKRATYGITLFVLLAVVLFYPFETTVVPEWKIRVVDAVGNPVKGVVVNQGWRHHSIEIHRQEQSLVADAEGYVTFPRRTARAGLLVRAVGSVIAEFNPHGRTGPYAFVDVLGPYSGTAAEYSPGKPIPTTITVSRMGTDR
jgi:hypothetical protein